MPRKPQKWRISHDSSVYMTFTKANPRQMLNKQQTALYRDVSTIELVREYANRMKWGMGNAKSGKYYEHNCHMHSSSNYIRTKGCFAGTSANEFWQSI